jgi:hypothetical protein
MRVPKVLDQTAAELATQAAGAGVVLELVDRNPTPGRRVGGTGFTYSPSCGVVSMSRGRGGAWAAGPVPVAC